MQIKYVFSILLTLGSKSQSLVLALLFETFCKGLHNNNIETILLSMWWILCNPFFLTEKT